MKAAPVHQHHHALRLFLACAKKILIVSRLGDWRWTQHHTLGARTHRVREITRPKHSKTSVIGLPSLYSIEILCKNGNTVQNYCIFNCCSTAFGMSGNPSIPRRNARMVVNAFTLVLQVTCDVKGMSATDRELKSSCTPPAKDVKLKERFGAVCQRS